MKKQSKSDDHGLITRDCLNQRGMRTAPYSLDYKKKYEKLNLKMVNIN